MKIQKEIYENLRTIDESIDIIKQSILNLSQSDILPGKSFSVCVKALKIKMDEVETLIKWAENGSRRDINQAL